MENIFRKGMYGRSDICVTVILQIEDFYLISWFYALVLWAYLMESSSWGVDSVLCVEKSKAQGTRTGERTS